ncbi:MAG: AtpZ/AtpI family protein [Alphaproteobacteria bacterium]|nr:AtpZ/AtpI family protein [Alphaproteobacteria bacterium]
MVTDPENLEALSDRIRAAEKKPAATPATESGSGIGFEFGGAIAVCALIGAGLDHWLGTSPWCLIGGAGLGFVAGMVSVWKGLQGPKT